MANESLSVDRSRYIVPILDRALGLLEELGKHPEGLPDAELDAVGKTVRKAANLISGRFGCNLEEVEA